MSIGQKLRAAREEKGLTCMEVADTTNMLIQMVREIEGDDFHRFAAPIYGKGFIKLFAKAVGLDPAPLIAEFTASLNEAAKAPRSTAPKTALKPTPLPTPAQPTSSPAETDEGTADNAEVPPVDPRAKRLKASTVTMPSADSPFAPANQPPSRQPAAPRPPADKTDEKTRDAQAFALESDTVASAGLPQPVEKSQEPFQYPTRARTPVPADAPDDHQTPKRKAVRPPRPKRPQLITSAMIAQGAAQLRNIFLAFRDRIAAVIATDNDEDSRIRNRYAMTGVLVCITVLAVIIIAASGSGKSNGNEQMSTFNATAGANQHEPTETQPVIADEETETLPEIPVEIVRVLPAPKMFAR